MPSRALRALCLAACCALAACDREASGPRPNLVLVIVDTLRRDHLEPYGYEAHPTSPALADLARESVVVQGFTGVSSWTQPSMATFFTGLEPAQHGVARLRDPLRQKDTLAQRFADAGYATACIMSNFLLVPGRSHGYEQGFQYYDSEIARKPDPHSGSTAAEVTRRGLDWLRQRTGDRPWFLTLHYFDPHVVYEEHPEYGFPSGDYRGWVRGGMPKQLLQRQQAGASDADRRQLAAYYDGEVRAVDDALAELIEGLRERADWNGTVLVFTADHGEELAERGYIGHTVSLHGEQVNLPLLVRLPGGRRGGTRIEARLPQADLYPTLLELCGIGPPARRGESFAGVITGDSPAADRICFSEVDFAPANSEYREKFTRMRSVIAEGYKLMHDQRRDRWHLYDLERDPREEQNLADDPGHADVRERLSELLRGHDWLVRE